MSQAQAVIATRTMEGRLQRYQERDGCWESTNLTLHENGYMQFDIWDCDANKWDIDITTTIKDVEATENHGDNRQFQLHTDAGTFHLLATNEAERNDWVVAIRGRMPKRQTPSIPVTAPATSKEGCLRRYQEHDDSWQHVNVTFMENCEARFDVCDGDSQTWTSDITVPIQEAAITPGYEEYPQFQIETDVGTVYLFASSKKERNEWVKAIRDQISRCQASLSSDESDSFSSNDGSDDTSSCAHSRSYSEKRSHSMKEIYPKERDGPNTANPPYPSNIASPSLSIASPMTNHDPQQMPVAMPTGTPRSSFTPTSSTYNTYSPTSWLTCDKKRDNATSHSMAALTPRHPPPFGFSLEQNSVYQEYSPSTPTVSPMEPFIPTSPQHGSHPPPARFNIDKNIGHSQPYPLPPPQQNNFNCSQSTATARYSTVLNCQQNAQTPLNRSPTVVVVPGLPAQKEKKGLQRQVTAVGKKALVMQAVGKCAEFFG